MAQNLLGNPGFETGGFSPWVADSNYIVLTNDAGVVAHSGTYYADTGCVGTACITPAPNTSGAWFYQDVPTTPGAHYTLTFWYAPGESGTDNTAELQVLWGATSSALTTGGAASCTGNCVFDNQLIGNTSYTQYTVNNLLATSSSMRLEFLGRQDPAESGVDDVSLTLTSGPTTVPVLGPGMLALLALMLAAVGWLMYRRLGRSAA
jgi:hypothetical protein